MLKKESVKKNLEKRENKSFVKDVISCGEAISIMLSILVALYSVMNEVYKIMYRRECELFYNIPSQYFESDINSLLFDLCCIIMLLLLSRVPAIIKKSYEESGNFEKGHLIVIIPMAILCGLEVGIFNVYTLIKIMEGTYKKGKIFQVIDNWFSNNPNFTIAVVITITVIAVLSFTLKDILENIKWKRIKEVVLVISSISLVGSLLLTVYGVTFKLGVSIEDKTKYEFITYEEEEYVVLSMYNEKNLIVPFEVDEKGQYTFITSRYMFCEQNEGLLRYRNIKYSPIIESSVE